MRIAFACPKSEQAIRKEIADSGEIAHSPVWFVSVELTGEDLLAYYDWNVRLGGHAHSYNTATINRYFAYEPGPEEVLDNLRSHGLIEEKRILGRSTQVVPLEPAAKPPVAVARTKSASQAIALMRNHAADGNAVVLVGGDTPGEFTIYCVDKSGKIYGTEPIQMDTFEDDPDCITEMVADFDVSFDRGEFPFIKEGRLGYGYTSRSNA